MLQNKHSRIHRTKGELIFLVFNTIFLSLVVFVTLYPMLYVLFSSVSDNSLLSQHRGLLLWPQGFDLSAIGVVLNNKMVRTGYANTLFIIVVGVTINVLLTSVCAYFLSRDKLPLQKLISRMIVFTMFFGGGLVPFYLIVQDLGMLNSIWSLILPVAMDTYNMLIMRSYFMSLPNSLEEAAKIDGAGHVTILFKIFLPLCLPVLAVMVLYYGVGHWNSWFNAMIFIQKKELYPLQLVLREILIQNQMSDLITSDADRMRVSGTIQYATIVVSTLPIICIYPFLQKYFVSGMTIGAVKG